MLGICSLSLFVTYVDTTILNVALPAIGRSFSASVTGLQWVADAYLLVLAALLVLTGSVADRIGRRRVFMTGLLAFGAGSAACSLAPSLGLLVAFRMLQALGGSMLTPVSLSIVRQVFEDPGERARALGMWSGIFGLGVACGPILGGLLVVGVGWRSVFWVNVPVVVAAWLLARRYVPESQAPVPRRVDLPGQVLVIVVLSTLTAAVIEGSSLGWGSPTIVAGFAVAAGAGVALVALESRRSEPLLELRFFKSPTFSAANAIAVAAFLVLSGFLFVNTLYLQEVRGDSALLAGLAVLPATTVIAATAPLAGILVARFGARLPLVISSTAMAVGCTILLRLTPSTPYAVLVVSYLLLGVGFGVVNPPITNTAVTGMPAAQAGVASAIASSSRQVGNVLGVAVMGALVTAADTGGASGHLRGQAGAAFSSATHVAWLLGVGCALGSAVIALTCTGRRGRAAAARVYADPEPDHPRSDRADPDLEAAG